MLDLTPELRARLRERLNDPEAMQAWRELLSGEAWERHVGYQRDAYDTTGSELHLNLRAFVDGELSKLRTLSTSVAGGGLLGRWLACEDVFALSEPGDRDPEAVRDLVGEEPLTAFRVGQTIFYLPGNSGAVWLTRPFAGDDDPLMRLPYQRKYDHERHGAADEVLRLRRERLAVAYDILEVLSERLTDRDVSESFSWPELDDIQEELNRMELAFSLGSLGAFFGGCTVELGVLADAGNGERRWDFTAASGSYDGVLGGYHRRPSGRLRLPVSGSSSKWMVTCALNELREQLWAVLYPSEPEVEDADGATPAGPTRRLQELPSA